MNRKMKTLTKALAIGLGVTSLASCGREPAPEPTPTPTDSPRSIFEGEGVTTETPAPVLPPLETTLGFPDGTSDLTESARAELATVLRSAQFADGGRIILRGHSDSAGSDTSNLEASKERAEAVRDFLVENGVSPERIEIIAFGEQNPVQPNALPDGKPNESGRAANRRVDLVVQTGAILQDDGRKPTLIEAISEGQTEAGEESEPASE